MRLTCARNLATPLHFPPPPPPLPHKQMPHDAVWSWSVTARVEGGGGSVWGGLAAGLSFLVVVVEEVVEVGGLGRGRSGTGTMDRAAGRWPLT